MWWRTVLQCLALAPLLFAGAGCNRAKAKPPTGPVINVNALDAARNELFNIAKKIEEPAAYQQLEHYVNSFEKDFNNPQSDWKWEDLYQLVNNGTYSIQTRTAYDNYRKTKIQGGKKVNAK